MALLVLDAVQQLRLHIDGSSLACLQTTASSEFLPPELCEFSYRFGNKLGLAKNILHKGKLHANVKPVSGQSPAVTFDATRASLSRVGMNGTGRHNRTLKCIGVGVSDSHTSKEEGWSTPFV